MFLLSQPRAPLQTRPSPACQAQSVLPRLRLPDSLHPPSPPYCSELASVSVSSQTGKPGGINLSLYYIHLELYTALFVRSRSGPVTSVLLAQFIAQQTEDQGAGGEGSQTQISTLKHSAPGGLKPIALHSIHPFLSGPFMSYQGPERFPTAHLFPKEFA